MPTVLHNAAFAEDVDANGQVASRDALLVINHLNGVKVDSANGESPAVAFLDVNADGSVHPVDALQVINFLNHGPIVPVLLSGQPIPPACTAADLISDVITECEVEQLLARGAAASKTDDAIIAIVDRGGRILGVRMEEDVLGQIPDDLTRSFAVDGAVAKARTAAFFSSDSAPLPSRTVRFISQSTITQREVESNPTVPNPLTDDPFDDSDPISRSFGPGFVAPIGIGGHFPPGVMNTPPVDLFAIEHQSRDSLVHPGFDGIKGTADDVALLSRFDVDPAFIPAGKELSAPESYGVQSGLIPHSQSRGIATLPGGVPLYKNGRLVGGVGVFFPGLHGYATFEQGFCPVDSTTSVRVCPSDPGFQSAGSQQTEYDRLNAPRVLESEWIAYATAGGSANASQDKRVGDLNGIPRVPGYQVPLGRIDLAGLTLESFGPHPTRSSPRAGVDTILLIGAALGIGSATSGINLSIDAGVDHDPLTLADNATVQRGRTVADGWLVLPHDSPLATGLKQSDVERIVDASIAEAQRVRAAIRLPVGARTRMVISVADAAGNVLGVYRMPDATIFSIDVSIAKARNTAYYADSSALQIDDMIDDDLLVGRGALTAAELAGIGGRTDGVTGVPELFTAVGSALRVSRPTEMALTNRTFRFLAEPRYPSGIDGDPPPIFSSLNDPGVDPLTAESVGAAVPASKFKSVLGFDAFHIGRNFRDPDDIAHQNGIVFFPGSTPLYVDRSLAGGFGVSGDGVDQDDVVTAGGQVGYEPPAELRADTAYYRNVRLPFQKFNRNPRG